MSASNGIDFFKQGDSENNRSVATTSVADGYDNFRLEGRRIDSHIVCQASVNEGIGMRLTALDKQMSCNDALRQLRLRPLSRLWRRCNETYAGVSYLLVTGCRFKDTVIKAHWRRTEFPEFRGRNAHETCTISIFIIRLLAPFVNCKMVSELDNFCFHLYVE